MPVNVGSRPWQETFGEWTRVDLTIDSGACETVGPPGLATAINIKESEGSKRGDKYRVANDDTIPNLGEKFIMGVNENGTQLGMTIQMADVTKPLGSV